MGVFNVTLLEDGPLAAATGKGETLYDGDSLEEANEISNAAGNNPAYNGRTIRFYDYHLFGGGIKDMKIAD